MAGHTGPTSAQNSTQDSLAFNRQHNSLQLQDMISNNSGAALTSMAAWAVAEVAKPATPLARTGLLSRAMRPLLPVAPNSCRTAHGECS